MSARWLLAMLMTCGTVGSLQAGEPETKAIAFLSREVPAWSMKNGCFSCHNNGDGARALYMARRRGYAVPAASLESTTAWLLQPAKWEQDLGDAEFKDARLTRIQFAAALLEITQDKDKASQRALADAARALAKDQAQDGSWPLVTGGTVASPVTYGPILSTHFARRVLSAADQVRYRDALDRSQRWLEQVKPASVMDSAALVWSLAGMETAAASQQRTHAIDLLRRAQGDDGGWGPYAISPPEAFDTAISLLALAEFSNPKAENPDLDPMLQRGRAYLSKSQQSDGS